MVRLLCGDESQLISHAVSQLVLSAGAGALWTLEELGGARTLRGVRRSWQTALPLRLSSVVELQSAARCVHI